MPALDQTGPWGMGPLTGRGLGPCAGGLAFGWGRGWHRGFGRGWGLARFFGWDLPQTKQDQRAALADYQKALEDRLEEVKKEQAELDQTE